MDPVVTLSPYDFTKSNRITVTVEFDADAQLADPDKAHLEPHVVRNHLLGQAATLCGKTAEAVLAGGGKSAQEVVAAVRAEKAEKIAAVEAEYAAREKLAAVIVEEADE